MVPDIYDVLLSLCTSHYDIATLLRLCLVSEVPSMAPLCMTHPIGLPGHWPSVGLANPLFIQHHT